VLRLIARDQLMNPGGSKVIVFCPTTKMTQLYATLITQLGRDVFPSMGMRVYELHSRRTQEARTKTSMAFRKATMGSHVLVTSDVSARGVDYPGVTNVIQIGIPSSNEQYVHRVGRTGRGGSVKGRGDFVLLPWENGFVTWQLGEVPLKSLPVKELERELEALEEVWKEKGPREFLMEKFRDAQAEGSTAGGRKFSGKGRVEFVEAFRPRDRNVQEEGLRLAKYEEVIERLMERIDPEAVKETFMRCVFFFFYVYF
jgi:ATP-dependent RNA helicase MSS116, mitochondrial